jgi:spermidine/putrescine-binding protein
MKTLIKIRIPSFLFALIFALACFGPSPTAQAQRDGIGNTATGTGALQNNTTGNYNTATGYRALFSNTSGTSNVGESA